MPGRPVATSEVAHSGFSLHVKTAWAKEPEAQSGVFFVSRMQPFHKHLELAQNRILANKRGHFGAHVSLCRLQARQLHRRAADIHRHGAHVAIDSAVTLFSKTSPNQFKLMVSEEKPGKNGKTQPQGSLVLRAGVAGVRACHILALFVSTDGDRTRQV